MNPFPDRRWPRFHMWISAVIGGPYPVALRRQARKHWVIAPGISYRMSPLGTSVFREIVLRTNAEDGSTSRIVFGVGQDRVPARPPSSAELIRCGAVFPKGALRSQ